MNNQKTLCIYHKNCADGFVISNEDLHHLSNPNGLQAQ